MKTVIFFLVVVLVLLLFILGFFYYEITAAIEKRTYRHKVYKVLHYYVEEKDQLLVNNAEVDIKGESEPVLFDHVVLADKYIYLVQDLYFDGAIYGNVSDPYIWMKDNKGKTMRIANPVLTNKKRMEGLEDLIGVSHDDHIFVSVIVYNSSLLVPLNMVTKVRGDFFLSVNDLEKTIKAAEKDEVPPIPHEKTEALVQLFKKRSDEIKADRQSN